jgi:hypothetical protein
MVSQIETRAYNWLYDSISDVWADEGSNATASILRTAYPSNQYNTIKRMQLKIPGDSRVASKTIAGATLHIFSSQGVVEGTTTTQLLATATYRKTTGLSFTDKGVIDGIGEKQIDITALIAPLNKSADWYIQLQLSLGSGVTLDEMFYNTLLSGSYPPFVSFTYS